VRTPASVNGIVGLKPTYGSVSTEGVIPSCPSLDHVGPLARRVDDCGLLFRVLSGTRSAAQPEPRPGSGDRPLKGIRLAVERRHFFNPAVEPAVAAAVEEALDVLQQLGATLLETVIPELELAAAVSSTIMVVEASRWHRTLLRERRFDYEPATRRMLELGQLLPATGYLQALRSREVVREAVRQAFERDTLNAIVAPSAPVTAPPIERSTELGGLVHHQCPANVTGQPSLSVPCGFSQDGLPIGLQLIGRPFEERTLFGIAAAYEDATTWHRRRPPVAA
jgi:Asp-tRNA(Asn)/Glu-tRNA(Gln) amidotransferase A subunit family amidase